LVHGVHVLYTVHEWSAAVVLAAVGSRTAVAEEKGSTVAMKGTKVKVSDIADYSQGRRRCSWRKSRTSAVGSIRSGQWNEVQADRCVKAGEAPGAPLSLYMTDIITSHNPSHRPCTYLPARRSCSVVEGCWAWWGTEPAAPFPRPSPLC
jgi:hypothetical protein